MCGTCSDGGVCAGAACTRTSPSPRVRTLRAAPCSATQRTRQPGKGRRLARPHAQAQHSPGWPMAHVCDRSKQRAPHARVGHTPAHTHTRTPGCEQQTANSARSRTRTRPHVGVGLGQARPVHVRGRGCSLGCGLRTGLGRRGKTIRERRSIRFRLSLCTYDAPPWGARVVSPTKSRKIPTGTQKLSPRLLLTPGQGLGVDRHHRLARALAHKHGAVGPPDPVRVRADEDRDD
jgi:hypothetical protein